LIFFSAGYEDDVLANDIAVIQVEKEFELNEVIIPVCLPKSQNILEEVAENACYATGWGKSPTGKYVSDYSRRHIMVSRTMLSGG
jgi:hypothetical protein